MTLWATPPSRSRANVYSQVRPEVDQAAADKVATLILGGRAKPRPTLMARARESCIRPERGSEGMPRLEMGRVVGDISIVTGRPSGRSFRGRLRVNL